MATYEVRVDLVGSSSDVERSFTALADAGEESAGRLEEAFGSTSDTVTGQLSGLADDGSVALSGIGDSAEENAGRISEAFAKTTGKVSGGLDDLAGTATEKSGVIADAFDKGFGEAGGASEGLVGKVSESLDALVAETTEKASLISARLDEAFAKGGLAAAKLNSANLSGTGKVGGVTSQAALASQLEQIEALNKRGLLSTEEAEAARAKVLSSISGGSLEQQLGVVGGLSSQGLISDAEVAATKAKLVGLGKTAEEEAGGIKSKVASAFKGIGSSIGNFGLPFAEQFNKMGESIEGAKTKAGSLKATLSSVGQLTTEVGAAAVIGFGAESIHLSDLYETAESQLKTAVRASGEAWDAYLPHLRKAQAETAKLGFNQTETAQALQILTTATNNPKKAIGDLQLVENVAREKGISLSESAQLLAKVYAGSTRVLTQFGINLDIGSGKLHSVQAASEAVTKAQMRLADAQKAAAQAGVVGSQNNEQAMLTEEKAANSLAQAHLSGSDAVANALENQRAAQAEVESGQIKGASAVAALQKSQMGLTQAIESGSLRNTAAAISYEKALKSQADTSERGSYAQIAAFEKVQLAQENLANAKLNLSQSKNAISDVLETLNKRTAGAAQNYVQTLPGQMKVLDAEIHNVGISFGEFLVPKLEVAGKDLEGVLSWFQKNSGAAKALAGVIGGSLALAVGVFAEQKAVKFGQSVGKMFSDLHKLEQGVVSVAGKILHLGQGATPQTKPEGQVSGVGQTSETSAGQVTGLGSAAETASGQVSGLGESAETASGQVAGLGTSSEEAAGTVSANAATMEAGISGIGPSAEVTEGTVTGAMVGMEGATDSAAVGMDAALGSTGVGALLIGIGLAATLLATHWKEVWGFVKEAAEDAWHFLDDEVVKPLERGWTVLWDKVRGPAESAWKFLDNSVIHPIEQGFSWLSGEVHKILHDGIAKDILYAVVPAVYLATHWKQVWKDVKDTAEDAWHFLDNDVIHPIERGFTSLKTGVSDELGALIGFIKRVPGDIIHLFADAGTWLVDAGKNLLEGLWHGISGEAGKVLHDVEGVGHHVLHALTHPWEILSPSHATARAGVFLIQGISVGAKSEEKALLGDLAKIGQDVKTEFMKIGQIGTTIDLRFGHEGTDLGQSLMTDLAKSIEANSRLPQAALSSLLANLEKEAKSSAMQQLHGQTLGGLTPTGAPSQFPHMTTTYGPINIDRVVANNPNELMNQLKVKARRAHSVRT